MDKKIYLSILASLVTACAVALFAYFALPVAKPLAWALIIGIATMPHHERLARHMPKNPGRSAGLMVLGVTVLFVIPLTALVITIAANAADWYHQAEQLVQAVTSTGASTLTRLPLMDRIMPLVDRYGIDLTGLARKGAGMASGLLVQLASDAAKNLANFFFTLALTLFILFFLYRDGEKIIATAVSRFASHPHKAQRYVTAIRSMTTAVTLGTLLTCAAQGVLAGIGYFVAGVPAPILCGAFTAVAALIPVVGTALIWVPLVGFLALNAAYLKAVLLAVWCLVFVGFADNAIRPLAIGATGEISTFAVVLGATCGVLTLGLLGLILGPVLFAVLISLWNEATAVDEDAEVRETSAP